MIRRRILFVALAAMYTALGSAGWVLGQVAGSSSILKQESAVIAEPAEFSITRSVIEVPAATAAAASPFAVANTAGMLNSETESKLREMVAWSGYDNQPLADLLDQIESTYQVKTVIDASARAKELNESTLMTIAALQVPLGRYLELALADHGCTITLDYGVVKIVSHEDSLDPQNLYTRIYDCSIIVDRLAASAETGFDAFSPEDLGLSADDRTVYLPRPLAARRLVQLVTRHVGSEHWRDHGGEAAIDYLDGRLVVTHRYSEQRQIEELLSQLAESASK